MAAPVVRTSRTEVRKSKEAQNNSKIVIIVLLLIATALLVYYSVILYLNYIELGTNQILPLLLLIGGIGLGIYGIRQINKMKFTAERQTSENITKIEGKFKALIQNSLDVITILDAKGTITYQSPSTERVLGYTPEELINENFYELIHTEDHPIVQNALNQKSAFMFSYRIQHKDGSWLYFESVGTNLMHNPLVAGYVINSRDITDRKKEEEEKRQKEVAALKFSIEREKAQLEKEAAEREKAIIEESKKQLEAAYAIIERKNQEITDSINYAFRIQTALLPKIDEIKAKVPESFVIWQPKDIVSGDFYWFATLPDGNILIACADCTGHGVPGAFMTMIGNTLLNQIVKQNNITEPDQILNNLHKGVRKALKQDEEGSKSRDGMDIAFMKLYPDTLKLTYAGANRPLWIVRKNNPEIEEIKPNKVPIGGLQTETERIFTPNYIQLQKGEAFYASTDGYHDQFGGPKGRKFMTKQMKEKILEIQDYDLETQGKILLQTIMDWMHKQDKDYEQIDDICVVGVKV